MRKHSYRQIDIAKVDWAAIRKKANKRGRVLQNDTNVLRYCIGSVSASIC